MDNPAYDPFDDFISMRDQAFRHAIGDAIFWKRAAIAGWSAFAGVFISTIVRAFL